MLGHIFAQTIKILMFTLNPPKPNIHLNFVL